MDTRYPVAVDPGKRAKIKFLRRVTQDAEFNLNLAPFPVFCMRYLAARPIDQFPCFLAESIYDRLAIYFLLASQ